MIEQSRGLVLSAAVVCSFACDRSLEGLPLACEDGAVCPSTDAGADDAFVPPQGPLPHGRDSSEGTLLISPAGNLVVFYTEFLRPGHEVWMAEYVDNEWISEPPLYEGCAIDKDSAALDGRGEYHVVIRSDVDDGAYYGRSDSNWLPTLIPTFPAGSLSASLDDSGAMHVAGGSGLDRRAYATNKSGTFVTADISDSASGPGSLVMAVGQAPAYAYFRREGGTVRVAIGPVWEARQSVIDDFSVDHSGTPSMKAYDGDLRVAYSMFSGSNYVEADLVFQTNASGRWERTVLSGDQPRAQGVDLTIDEDGFNHIVAIHEGGALRYYTDRTGQWRAHLIGTDSCEPAPIDSIHYLGWLIVLCRGQDLRPAAVPIRPDAFD